jgi:hypothetical protein
LLCRRAGREVHGEQELGKRLSLIRSINWARDCRLYSILLKIVSLNIRVYIGDQGAPEVGKGGTYDLNDGTGEVGKSARLADTD